MQRASFTDDPRRLFPQIALHGTDELPDELFTRCIDAGATKVSLAVVTRRVSWLNTFAQINVNSWCRDPMTARLAEGLAAGEPLPDIYEACTETYAKACERFFTLFRSAGRAQ